MPFARQTAVGRSTASGRADAAGRVDSSARTVPTVPPDIILLGDSITSACGIPAAQTNLSWYDSANTTLGNVFSLSRNAGISGDTTALMLARLQSDVLYYWSSWVCVLGGINDITGAVASATTIANLTAIYDAILAGGARLICCVVLPCTSLNTGPLHTTVDAINTAIRAYAASHSPVVLCDWWSVFSDPNTDSGYSPVAGYTSDGKHPSATGAGVMGTYLAGVVNAVKPGTAGV